MTLSILHVEDNPIHARLARAAVDAAAADWRLTSVGTLVRRQPAAAASTAARASRAWIGLSST